MIMNKDPVGTLSREDIDKKIKSLVKEADDLLGMDADIYKRELNNMLDAIDDCNFVKATRNLILISNELDDQAKIFLKTKVSESKVIPFDDISSRISRGVRLETETIHAFKFLLSEKCGCKLK